VILTLYDWNTLNSNIKFHVNTHYEKARRQHIYIYIHTYQVIQLAYIYRKHLRQTKLIKSKKLFVDITLTMMSHIKCLPRVNRFEPYINRICLLVLSYVVILNFFPFSQINLRCEREKKFFINFELKFLVPGSAIPDICQLKFQEFDNWIFVLSHSFILRWQRAMIFMWNFF
jgi:hypothetical protein